MVKKVYVICKWSYAFFNIRVYSWMLAWNNLGTCAIHFLKLIFLLEHLKYLKLSILHPLILILACIRSLRGLRRHVGNEQLLITFLFLVKSLVFVSKLGKKSESWISLNMLLFLLLPLFPEKYFGQSGGYISDFRVHFLFFGNDVIMISF